MSGNETVMIKCSLCGFEYDPDATKDVCCGCPMKGGCKMAKCPNCGYETPAPRRKSKGDKRR